MSFKTAIKVVLVLMAISILLLLDSVVPGTDVKSLLVGLLTLPACFILFAYIPSLIVILMVKLFPKHKELRYLPTLLAVDAFLFFTHRQFFDNSVNTEFFEILFYLLVVILCFITFISSFIAAKNNY